MFRTWLSGKTRSKSGRPRSLWLESLEGRTLPSFLAPVHYDAGPGAAGVTVADLTGTGTLDVITVNRPDNSVSVLMGNGDGTFQAPVRYAVGRGPNQVAVADLNNDGNPDLIVSNSFENTVSVLLGNGDGTFQKPVAYAAGAFTSAVVVGDFRGIGIADLAVADQAPLGGTPGVAILLGNGDGTFQSPTVYATDGFPPSVATGDFNNDGVLDLVTANANSGHVSVLLGNGDGTFQPARNLAAGDAPYSVAVADFNQDGNADIVAVTTNGFTPSTLTVLLGNGDGTFRNPISISTGEVSNQLAVGDVNGDSFPDVVVVNPNSNTVSVFINAADWGGLAPQGGGQLPGGQEAATLDALATENDLLHLEPFTMGMDLSPLERWLTGDSEHAGVFVGGR